MADRPSYLAHTLLSRLRSLEEAELDEEKADEHRQARQRESLVSKVLAVEEGITDGATVQRVAQALPPVKLQGGLSDQDRDELAEFLREQLRLRDAKVNSSVGR
jgi:hypothetical protein